MCKFLKYNLLALSIYFFACSSNNGGTILHKDNHIESIFKKQIHQIFPAFTEGEFWLEMDDFSLLKVSIIDEKISSEKHNIVGLDFEAPYLLMPQYEETTLIVKYGRGLSKVDLKSKQVSLEYVAGLGFSSGTETWLVPDKSKKNLRSYFEHFVPNSGGESVLKILNLKLDSFEAKWIHLPKVSNAFAINTGYLLKAWEPLPNNPDDYHTWWEYLDDALNNSQHKILAFLNKHKDMFDAEDKIWSSPSKNFALLSNILRPFNTEVLLFSWESDPKVTPVFIDGNKDISDDWKSFQAMAISPDGSRVLVVVTQAVAEGIATEIHYGEVVMTDKDYALKLTKVYKTLKVVDTFSWDRNGKSFAIVEDGNTLHHWWVKNLLDLPTI